MRNVLKWNGMIAVCDKTIHMHEYHQQKNQWCKISSHISWQVKQYNTVQYHFKQQTLT